MPGYLSGLFYRYKPCTQIRFRVNLFASSKRELVLFLEHCLLQSNGVYENFSFAHGVHLLCFEPRLGLAKKHNRLMTPDLAT
jgi:predicted glycosyltransferase involved in capsule biosynthesis